MGVISRHLAGIVLVLAGVGSGTLGAGAVSNADSPQAQGSISRGAKPLQEVPDADAVTRAEALVRDIFRDDCADVHR